MSDGVDKGEGAGGEQRESGRLRCRREGQVDLIALFRHGGPAAADVVGLSRILFTLTVFAFAAPSPAARRHRHPAAQSSKAPAPA